MTQHTMLNDDQLLERARAGDTQALSQLLEQHQAQVYRFGMKMCRNPEDAKDVLQVVPRHRCGAWLARVDMTQAVA